MHTKHAWNTTLILLPYVRDVLPLVPVNFAILGVLPSCLVCLSAAYLSLIKILAAAGHMPARAIRACKRPPWRLLPWLGFLTLGLVKYCASPPPSYSGKKNANFKLINWFTQTWRHRSHPITCHNDREGTPLWNSTRPIFVNGVGNADQLVWDVFKILWTWTWLRVRSQNGLLFNTKVWGFELWGILHPQDAISPEMKTLEK